MLRTCCVLALLLAADARAQAVPRATSPDRKFEASATGAVINISTGQPAKLLIQIRSGTDDVTALAYSPDGKLLASGDKGGSVRLFAAATGKALLALRAGAGVTKVAFSADGRTVAATAGGKATKFDVATGKVVE